MKRRDFIKITTLTASSQLLPACSAYEAASRKQYAPVDQVSALPSDVSRTWIGPDYWANRLQDWRLKNGRIECLRDEAGFEVRTVSLLTRQLNTSHKAGRIQARVGCINPEKPGFCGFLLGVGGGHLEYRGAALAQRFSGTGGGFMAVIDEKGNLSFRDFSSHDKPLAFEQLSRPASINLDSVANKEILLDCHIDPVADGKFDVRLIASDANSKEELGFAVRLGVAADELVGNISLLSSPPAKSHGSRWWLSDVKTGGDKIAVNPNHALGPVMGCMHSLNKNVLKMSAQFMPISTEQQPEARLEYRVVGSGGWQNQTVEIGDGFVALFRIDTWDSSKDYEYRVVYPSQPEKALFSGKVVRDPGTSKDLNIALFSCQIPTSKSLDRGEYGKFIPAEEEYGRYEPANIVFPHQPMVDYCESLSPDLYLFCGDQYYETFPTQDGGFSADAKLDTLYRWYLWYWCYRDVLKNKPCIVVADDHDILQGNLWGNKGISAASKKEEEGGYKRDKGLVRMIYRVQHGHNPDPYDPTPIAHDIPVTYGSFVYGGVSFAVVEDRKFKTPPKYDVDPTTVKGDLLGARQEKFLAEWKNMDPGLPKICLTASMWGSPQTAKNGKPLLDYDANGYPFDGRTRAVKLVSDAKAVVLTGDQHLGLAAVQGVNDYEDGALFFAGPAVCSFWERWFEGMGKLENQRNNDPNTGHFIDTFGNKMRVLAVANPKLTFDEFAAQNESWGMFMSDRKLKSEGYGFVRVQHEKQQYVMECWSWDANPASEKPFPGWPLVWPFPNKQS
jgi:alkaline phosphatase D